MGNKSKGMYLLQQGKKGIFRIVFSRFGIMTVLILLQATVLIGGFFWFRDTWSIVSAITNVGIVVMVMHLLNVRMNSCAKITWLIIIMMFPIFGLLLFWFTQREWGHRFEKKRLTEIIDETRTSIIQDKDTLKEVGEESKELEMLASYLARTGCYPIYKQSEVTYFPSGEAKFEALLEQLNKAEKFIFLEYYIIDEGTMWGQILEILAQKAKEGVEVRIMYDGMCEFALLPHNYPERLKSLGLKCKVFAPIAPLLSTYYNYRDHRKILVIDGQVAFTGGVNLADEYINQKERFGYWKDAAVMIQGEAVKSFTLMFLQIWNMDEKQPDFYKYINVPAASRKETKGYVMPYGDSPLDDDKSGERVYMDIINRANKYVHIMTPYLIIDDEMEGALRFAAKRGVDVRIILPGIPDKKSAYSLAKTHYRSLIEAGVKVYEYTPGFVHAKVFSSDDCKAVVGTINMDYRSLYHHFECGVYLYQTDCITEIEKDFAETLKACRIVTPETIRAEKWWMKALGWILKAVAPLM